MAKSENILNTDIQKELQNKGVTLEPDEFLETLGSGVKIVCSPVHGFGTDAIILADFAAPKRNDKVCDLGTGCGIIPFIWLRNGVKGEIYGVDIQERATQQFEKSKLLNPTNTNIKAINHDLRNIKAVLPTGYFNVVTMNPPYKPVDTGILSDTTPDKIARHEIMCTVTDATEAAAKLLNFGGKFCMCHRPERLCDVICAFREAGIEPKRIRFVQKRPDTEPWLFLIEGKKGAKPHITVLPPLYIQDENGNNSEELNSIIGEYAE